MKKKRIYPLLGLLLSAAIVGIGCSNTTNNSGEGSNSPSASSGSSATAKPAAERVMKDALGHEVNIPAKPERIIATYLEDHLVALGVKPVAQWSINNGKSVQNYLQKVMKEIPTIPSDLPL